MLKKIKKKKSGFTLIELIIVIAIIAPLGLSLYWLVSNILQLFEKIIVDKVMNKKEEA